MDGNFPFQFIRRYAVRPLAELLELLLNLLPFKCCGHAPMLAVHPVAVPAVRLLFRLQEHVRTKPLT